MRSRDPITPSTIASRDLQVAADDVDLERRTERMRLFTRGLAGGVALLVVVVGVAAVLLARQAPVPPIAAAAMPFDAQPAALLGFTATADEGRVATWAYSRPGSPVADIVTGSAGSRSPRSSGTVMRDGMSDTALLARAREQGELQGAPPAPLPFTQSGEDVAVDVDGVTRHLQWTLWDEPCANSEGATRQWRLCDVAHARCIEAPLLTQACWQAPVALVSLHRSGDVLWVIAERRFQAPLGIPRMAAGGVMPELFNK
ncbi:MAG: hypothetical protein Q8O67_00030 [Deltaproteobacteria bacterium]|nr:hypothetical protein [Deltaproteobacteria bacterium]